MTREQAEALIEKLLHARAVSNMCGEYAQRAGNMVCSPAWTPEGEVLALAHKLGMKYWEKAEEHKRLIVEAMVGKGGGK